MDSHEGEEDGKNGTEAKIFVFMDLSMRLLVVVIHTFGILFLTKYAKLFAKTQRLYFISLSTSTMLISTHHILTIIIDLTDKLQRQKSWFVVIEIIHIYGIWFIYYITLIALTLDRFGEVFYNIKYPLYVTQKKTFVLIIVLWIFGICVASSFLILTFAYSVLPYKDKDYDDISQDYLYPILDTALVINALIVYTYIYIKLDRTNKLMPRFSRRSESQSSQKLLPCLCLIRRRNNQKFFVPALIIVTFIIFVCIPDAIRSAITIPPMLKRIATSMYSINMISDVIIYIFFTKSY